MQNIFNKTHKEFNSKDVLFNEIGYEEWYKDSSNNDSKKDGRYFLPHENYNNEKIYF